MTGPLSMEAAVQKQLCWRAGKWGGGLLAGEPEEGSLRDWVSPAAGQCCDKDPGQ